MYRLPEGKFSTRKGNFIKLEDILNDAIISIVKEVQSKSVGTITISAVVTLWSAGRGFFALCKGHIVIFWYFFDFLI